MLAARVATLRTSGRDGPQVRRIATELVVVVAFGDTPAGRLCSATWYRVANRAVQTAAPCVFPEGLLFRRPPGIAGQPGTARAG